MSELRTADVHETGFARMMDAILDNRSFAKAVTTGYAADLQALWLRFEQAQSTPR